MKRVVLLSLIALGAVIGISLFAYGHAANLAVLNPHGIIALHERGVIYITLGLSAIVVVPVFVLLFYFAWRYRASNPKTDRKHEPNWDHDSRLAEFLWWLVPTVIIGFLSFIIWQTSHDLDPYVPIKSDVAPITIQVVALNWKWLFIYPEQHIATVNMIEFPKNTPIHFEITADAPVNSFWIPSLGGQIMAMPGMVNHLYLLAATTGNYKGVSGNISGKGFAGMEFTAHAVTKDEFDAWVAETSAGSNPLTEESYAALAEPSEYVPVSMYSSVDPALYTSINMKYMMPAMDMHMEHTAP